MYGTLYIDLFFFAIFTIPYIGIDIKEVIFMMEKPTFDEVTKVTDMYWKSYIFSINNCQTLEDSIKEHERKINELRTEIDQHETIINRKIKELNKWKKETREREIVWMVLNEYRTGMSN